MAMLLFQTSRLQFLDRLRSWINEIPAATTMERQKSRRETLEKALRAAKKHFDYVE
jgi:hypothetical protein